VAKIMVEKDIKNIRRELLSGDGSSITSGDIEAVIKTFPGGKEVIQRALQDPEPEMLFFPNLPGVDKS